MNEMTTKEAIEMLKDCTTRDYYALPRISGYELVVVGPADSEGFRWILVQADDGTYTSAVWQECSSTWQIGRPGLSFREGIKHIFG